MDKAFSGWMRNISTVDISLATHRPVRWALEWQWNHMIVSLLHRTHVNVERSSGQRLHTKAGVAKWGGVAVQENRPSQEQKRAIASLWCRWQESARLHASFTYGDASNKISVDDKVGMGLVYEEVDPAVLVARKPRASPCHEVALQAVRSHGRLCFGLKR